MRTFLSWILVVAILACVAGIAYLVLDMNGLLPGQRRAFELLEPGEGSETEARLRRRLIRLKDEVQVAIADRKERGHPLGEAEARYQEALKAFEARRYPQVESLLKDANDWLENPRRKARETAPAPAAAGKEADPRAPIPSREELQKRLEPLTSKVLEIAEKDPEADYLFGLLDDAHEAMATEDLAKAWKSIQVLSGEAERY